MRTAIRFASKALWKETGDCRMTSSSRYLALFLDAGPEMQCGVGQFTRLLRETIEKSDPGISTTLTLTRSQGSVVEIWRAVGTARRVVCNFPIVAWKRVIWRPLLALALARWRRRRAILVLHEWNSLHWLRRITYRPALLLANIVVTFSPLVRREIARDPLVGRTAHKCVLAPLPPNIEAPAQIADSKLRRQLAAARKNGRLVIGHFGSIYPGKQPNALLDIAAVLKERGRRPLIVYIGSFIKAFDNIEQDFYARANELGIAEDVIVSGYVASDAEVFGLFSEIDAFCYPLEEGLTARRSSILACVQSGRPVIVTSPSEPDEFDHHSRCKALIDHGAILPMARGSDGEAYAATIIASLKQPTAFPPFNFANWWRDMANAIKAQL
jgi:glycosyltransferase involved in cell wall biosynthesis